MQMNASPPANCDFSTFGPTLFRALCDPSRLAILSSLIAAATPRSVSAIADSGACARDLSVVSRHLSVLSAAGILERARQGKEVVYRVRAAELAGVLRRLADMLEKGAASQPDGDSRGANAQ